MTNTCPTHVQHMSVTPALSNLKANMSNTCPNPAQRQHLEGFEGREGAGVGHVGGVDCLHRGQHRPDRECWWSGHINLHRPSASTGTASARDKRQAGSIVCIEDSTALIMRAGGQGTSTDTVPVPVLPLDQHRPNREAGGVDCMHR